jgi:hypothetical protein
MRRAAIIGLALSACSDAIPPQPMTLPPADGRPEVVQHDSYRYEVGRQALAQAEGKVFLRVTRVGGPDMDYSEGMTAKAVAAEYCGKYNRRLNPVAYGMFSAPASWVFEGGCT